MSLRQHGVDRDAHPTHMPVVQLIPVTFPAPFLINGKTDNFPLSTTRSVNVLSGHLPSADTWDREIITT